MKSAALTCLVLCCCATVPPGTLSLAPSSLPVLHVDPLLSGERISPDGMRVVLKKRDEDRAKNAKIVADLMRDVRVLTMQRDGAEHFASRNAFWGTWGPTIAVSSGIGGAALAAALFLAVLFGGFAHGK